MSRAPLVAVCQCGKVKLEADDPPIATAICYCTSCQAAGRRFELLPGAPIVLDPDGGSSLVLCRKDRVHCATGQEHLQERRLRPDSPTRRVLAACCNTPMFVDFTKGHWLSLFRSRIASGAPPASLRVMTKERRAGVEFSDDIPSYPKHSGKFMVKLLAAWVAMGFRKPKTLEATPASGPW